MPWKYVQRTGQMFQPDGALLATGYAGAGVGKNVPEMEGLANVGPIPRGNWVIGEAFQSQEFGPVVMRLQPAPGTATHGRAGFLIHGDSTTRPGAASHGCIILPRTARLAIAASSDRALEVVEQ